MLMTRSLCEAGHYFCAQAGPLRGMNHLDVTMTVKAYLEEDADTSLWGLTPRGRLQKMLSAMDGVELGDTEAAVAAGSDVLLLRADYVYDPRVLSGLLQARNVVLRDPEDKGVIAVRTRLEGDRAAPPRLAEMPLQTLEAVTPDSVASGLQSDLRKFDAPWVARADAHNSRQLENALYRAAYKGVTDLVTKWVWPIPARAVTRLCAYAGIRPNHVTSLSYVLTLLAGMLFWQGQYGLGLICAWLMTFLDTVDGKLARVTLNSSQFGNLFDHLLDLIHPPFWYLAWGIGLAADVPEGVYWLIFIGYIGGRLCEGAFKTAAPFSLFIWRPFDSINRLITARRNPNLILLTLAWLLGAPYAGLLLVMLWTLISTLVLAWRVVQARRASRRGELSPWLSHVDPVAERHRLTVRWFAFADGKRV
ncbi:phosphatidylglycerophosphate synthase [Halomonas ventosae]|uniref:Phosphatidylglycerophosphate synthase n=2 Tax=Halomonadaceae TaxID=28256 RepID=A0A4R6HGB3_9GAMM|nr:phosphatidylglycerophosphate synthase [Halomonas ventosae]